MKQENASLEERLMLVSGERETMLSGLEEARERNMMLEKTIHGDGTEGKS